jgi:hypothetical protein
MGRIYAAGFSFLLQKFWDSDEVHWTESAISNGRLYCPQRANVEIAVKESITISGFRASNVTKCWTAEGAYCDRFKSHYENRAIYGEIPTPYRQ